MARRKIIISDIEFGSINISKVSDKEIKEKRKKKFENYAKKVQKERGY